ncbi:hypothetical protein JCM8547_003469 [Rhodosporidiobolus lusitaniae]
MYDSLKQSTGPVLPPDVQLDLINAARELDFGAEPVWCNRWPRLLIDLWNPKEWYQEGQRGLARGGVVGGQNGGAAQDESAVPWRVGRYVSFERRTLGHVYAEFGSDLSRSKRTTSRLSASGTSG